MITTALNLTNQFLLENLSSTNSPVVAMHELESYRGRASSCALQHDTYSQVAASDFDKASAK